MRLWNTSDADSTPTKIYIESNFSWKNGTFTVVCAVVMYVCVSVLVWQRPKLLQRRLKSLFSLSLTLSLAQHDGNTIHNTAVNASQFYADRLCWKYTCCRPRDLYTFHTYFNIKIFQFSRRRKSFFHVLFYEFYFSSWTASSSSSSSLLMLLLLLVVFFPLRAPIWPTALVTVSYNRTHRHTNKS